MCAPTGRLRLATVIPQHSRVPSKVTLAEPLPLRSPPEVSLEPFSTAKNARSLDELVRARSPLATPLPSTHAQAATVAATARIVRPIVPPVRRRHPRQTVRAAPRGGSAHGRRRRGYGALHDDRPPRARLSGRPDARPRPRPRRVGA